MPGQETLNEWFHARRIAEDHIHSRRGSDAKRKAEDHIHSRLGGDHRHFNVEPLLKMTSGLDMEIISSRVKRKTLQEQEEEDALQEEVSLRIDFQKMSLDQVRSFP